MHEMLTNQILLFNFGTVSNTLATVCKTNTGAVLWLQIVNYLISNISLSFLEGERGSGLIDYSFMG